MENDLRQALTETEFVPAEASLDPADWEAMRSLAHQMVADMFTYLQTVRERPVWQPVPGEVREHFSTPLPQEPQPPEQVYQEFVEKILPYPMGNIHPRFWGWVMGNGTVLGALAEFLAGVLNPNMGGGNHVGMYVEQQVLDWLKEVMGFPPEASGLLVSGGSMANLVALNAARYARAGFDVRAEGLRAGPQLTVYASTETHSSVQKAVELMGLGKAGLRLIPVEADYRIDISALEETIRRDREAGMRPIAVVGNAGTVNTGALDDLQALAEICRREDLWFHVDGAFGGLVRLSPALHPLVQGLELADSVAFDLHKWMYLQFEAGCVLVREASLHRQAFSLTPEYLAHTGERGLASGATWYSDYGVQLTRGFRALKAWMAIKEHGARKYGQLIEQNMAQARYLADLVSAEPDLELLAPVPLNIVCFRYRPAGVEEARLNELNQELLVRLHESGVAVPSYTTLGGRYALRAAITNHRSRREDFDLLVKTVIELGRSLVSQYR